MVYSCAQRCKVVLLRIMFCSCMHSCVHFCEKWQLVFQIPELSENDLTCLLDQNLTARIYKEGNEGRFNLCVVFLGIIYSRQNRLLNREGIPTSVVTSARQHGFPLPKNNLVKNKLNSGIKWQKQLLNSVIAKYCDMSVSRRSIICLSLRLWQITDLLATDKLRYFAQPRPITSSSSNNWTSDLSGE